MKLYDGHNDDFVVCCFMTCWYEKLGFIADGEYIPSGIISSFAASVDYDSMWMTIIESSVKRCFDTIPFDLKYDCSKGMTQEYMNVMDCAFLQNYVQCPYPLGPESCKWAMKYVENCYKAF